MCDKEKTLESTDNIELTTFYNISLKQHDRHNWVVTEHKQSFKNRYYYFIRLLYYQRVKVLFLNWYQWTSVPYMKLLRPFLKKSRETSFCSLFFSKTQLVFLIKVFLISYTECTLLARGLFSTRHNCAMQKTAVVPCRLFARYAEILKNAG